MKHMLSAILMVLSMSGCGTLSQMMGYEKSPGYKGRPIGFQANAKATVTIHQVNASLGTGVVIRKDGYIITNWHVIVRRPQKQRAPNGSIVESLSSGKYLVCQEGKREKACVSAVLVKSDEKRDLALLKADHAFPHAVIFGNDKSLKHLDFLYSWARVGEFLPASPFKGHYVGKMTAGSYAIEGSAEKLVLHIDHHVMDLSLNAGGSGSPIFNRAGHCVGISRATTDKILRGAPLGLFIPSSVVMDFLSEVVDAHVTTADTTSK